MDLVLVHSPLAGPSTWEPMASLLRSAGHRAAVPSLAGIVDGNPPYIGRLAAVVARAAGDGPYALVVHSGAGALVPSIVARQGDVTAAVFVDAVLPAPGRSWFETVPDELAAHLRGLALGDRLPPWHRWFGEEAIAALLPDPEARKRFCAEVPSLPLDYFEQPAPPAPGWPSVPCGYVRLSAAYEAEEAWARRDGWPVAAVDADHLAMLTRPGEVLPAVEGVLARL